MPRQLLKLPWRDDFLDAVQDLYFGDAYWEREIEHWIKHEVIDTVREYGTEVWLYATEEDGPIGYGALGASRWNWPFPTSKRVPINIIPAVGIDRRFWGQPRGDDEHRFSDQILDHLIYEAQQRHERQPALGLFVHPETVRAIRVYERAGFTRFSQGYINEDGIEYVSMVLEWERA